MAGDASTETTNGEYGCRPLATQSRDHLSGHWIRDSAGQVWLVPVARFAVSCTDQGDIALSLGGPGWASRLHGGQYLCTATEAMDMAKMLVRAAALADREEEQQKTAAEKEAAQ